MDSDGPTVLSLIGAGLYVLVAMLSCRVALRARARLQSASESRWWLAIGLLFIALALMRVFVVEDQLREVLRAGLVGHDLYAIRRSIQWPIAFTAFAASFGIIWLSWRGYSQSCRASGHSLWIAKAACTIMISLVAIRLISYGPIDYVLDGPMRINWIVDIGSTFIVAYSSWRYSKQLDFEAKTQTR